MGRQDDRPPLDRALSAAGELKAGTWESVEALSVLAIASKHQDDGVQMLASALAAASSAKAGSWDSVRALAWLAQAERELGSS